MFVHQTPGPGSLRLADDRDGPRVADTGATFDVDRGHRLADGASGGAPGTRGLIIEFVTQNSFGAIRGGDSSGCACSPRLPACPTIQRRYSSSCARPSRRLSGCNCSWLVCDATDLAAARKSSMMSRLSGGLRTSNSPSPNN